MHIAYFTNQYPKVSHSFIRREIQALERQGHEISRFAIRGWDAELADTGDIAERSKTRYLLGSGVVRLVLPTLWTFARSPVSFLRTLILALRSARGSDRGLAYHLVYLMEACELLRLIGKTPVSHLHAHFGTNAAEVAMLAHCLGGPPYSFTVHGPEEFDRPDALHLAEKIKRAKFTVSVSSFGSSQLYRCVAHEYWPKIAVVHCGLERSFYEGKTAGNAQGRELICVGRLCEQKGQMLLVEAAGLLASKGLDFKVVFAGDGEMRADIEALASGLKIADRIKITGWLNSAQVRDLILRSRAMVQPSFAEGLPVVIMEAMSLKRPVLATYIAGIPELVIDGENGWLIPAGSVDALAEAMEACLQTGKDELARMGEAGYGRVVQMHDIDMEAAKLAALVAADDELPAGGVSSR